MLRSLFILAVAASQELLPDDVCNGEECALSLRQLRGQQAEAEVNSHEAAPLAEVDELGELIEVTPDTAPEIAEKTETAEATEAETPATPEAPATPETEDEAPETEEAPEAEEEDSYGDEDEGEEPVPKVNDTKLQLERETAEGGTCCFSGESKKDTCGTCFPMSIASYKSKCSKKDECGGCGGTWCPGHCAIGAADPFHKCKTAYPTGISKDPVCGRDEAGCKSCQGQWCRAGWNSNFQMEENAHGREVPTYVAPAEETEGACCYRGESKDDMCGTCADIAKDSTCSVKSRCAGCGGTWCPSSGPKCVKAFKNKDDPCHSAYPMTGIAGNTDFCSLNEKHCTSCKGAWCEVANLTYYDGHKYEPGKQYVPISDQRLTPENETATQEAEEEVANDDTLDDLFPDGLAHA